MPAVQALAAYRGYKKLFGERLHASKYVSSTDLDLPSNALGAWLTSTVLKNPKQRLPRPTWRAAQPYLRYSPSP